MAAEQMVRALLVVSLLSTSAAWAQSVTLEYATQDATTLRFNASACSTPVTVLWTSTVTFGLCSELKLWATELECTDTSGPNDFRFTSVSQLELAAGTGDFVVTPADLPAFKFGDAGVVCGTDAVERPH